MFRFQAPARDEESESQRKARSRLMRQSRRSTQVLLTSDWGVVRIYDATTPIDSLFCYFYNYAKKKIDNPSISKQLFVSKNRGSSPCIAYSFFCASVASHLFHPSIFRVSMFITWIKTECNTVALMNFFGVYEHSIGPIGASLIQTYVYWKHNIYLYFPLVNSKSKTHIF